MPNMIRKAAIVFVTPKLSRALQHARPLDPVAGQAEADDAHQLEETRTC